MSDIENNNIENDKDIIISRTLTDIKRNKSKRATYEDNVEPHLAQIKDWRKMGATDKEIADVLGIHCATLCKWKKQHTELNKALRSGTELMLLEVKASLLKQALGYRERDVRTVIKQGVVVQQEIFEKYIPPNERAVAMILRNYDKDYIEKGKDVNMQSLTEELAKTGLIKITDDISEALRKASEESEDINSKSNEDKQC